MKNIRVYLSLFLALMIVLTHISLITNANNQSLINDVEGTTVTSTTEPTTVLPETDDYVIKFSSSQANKLLTCDEMATLLGEGVSNGGEYEIEGTTEGASVVYNDDYSITLSKPSTLYGVNLEVPVTDEMRNEYIKNTSHNLRVSFYLAKSLNEDLLFANTQVRIYTRFKTQGQITIEDNTLTSYLKSSSLKSVHASAYQPFINKEFQLIDFDENVLENLDNVESIIISLYHYEYTDAVVEFSGIAYENNAPKIKQFVAPTPETPDKSVTLFEYRREYDKKWTGHPSTVKYNPNGGYKATEYKTTEIGDVYLKNINDVSTKQLTLYYDFDKDMFNKGIVTANQEGGSKQATITLNVTKLHDTNNEEMLAEFQLQFFMYDGSVKTLFQEWVSQGTQKTFQFDVSEVDINSVSYIKLSLQNYWKYCAEDGRFYDFDQKVEEDGKIYCRDNLGNEKVDVTDKVLVDRTMRNIEAFVSRIKTVGTVLEETTATTVIETTTPSEPVEDYEYAGYHFMDFKQESLNECYGNNPSHIDFLFDDHYQRYSLEKNTYKDNNSSGTKIEGDDQYKLDFAEASGLSSGGYQLQISSGFEKSQVQYQSSYFKSGALEDAERTSSTQDHEKPLEPQNEKYDYTEQMANAIKYANENPDPKLTGYLAMDVYLVSSIHGYKNSKNKTYKAWCKKNNKELADEKSGAEIQLMIHAKDKDGVDCSTEVVASVMPGNKTTIFIDVSELNAENVTNVRVVAQNYGNLANREQGGDNLTCGITNVTARYSAIYVPGNKQSEEITTTILVTRPFDEKDAKKIKKLYDKLPGLSVDDYETEADYDKLAAFQKVWTDASDATQKYCEEEYDIDYASIGMLEMDVYDKIYGSGSWEDEDSDDVFSPSTDDMAFPAISLLLVCLSGCIIFKSRKKR